MLEKSSASLKIFYQDINGIKKSLKKTLKIWKTDFPEICRIYIFGSFIKGNFTPRSDLDILLVLSDSKYFFKDRITAYYPDNFPIPLDIFPFTIDEIKKMQNHPSIFKTAIETGLEVNLK